MWFPLFHVRAETVSGSREFRLRFIDDGFEVTDLFHTFHSPTVHTNKHPERRGRPVLIGGSARRSYRNMGIVSIIVITMPAGISTTFISPVMITSFTLSSIVLIRGRFFLRCSGLFSSARHYHTNQVNQNLSRHLRTFLPNSDPELDFQASAAARSSPRR